MTGQGYRRRHRLIKRFRAQPAVEIQARQAIGLAKGIQRLDRLEAVGVDALQRQIDALVGKAELYFRCPARLEKARQQGAQGADQREQLRAEDVAFAHVDDAVGFFRVEAEHHALPDAHRPERGAAPAVRRRKVRLADLRAQPMLRQRSLDARAQIAAISFVVGMLELAPAALGKVTAWRHLVVRSRNHAPVIQQRVARNREGDVAPAFADALAAPGNPNDRFARSKPSQRFGNGGGQIVRDHVRAGNFGGAAVEPDSGRCRFECGKPARAHRRDHSGEHISGARRWRAMPGPEERSRACRPGRRRAYRALCRR